MNQLPKLPYTYAAEALPNLFESDPERGLSTERVQKDVRYLVPINLKN